MRFSLRNLLLVMAAICGVAAAAGYEINWIKQRRDFRTHQKFTFVESPDNSRDPLQPRAPHGLWLFGEPGVAFMTMEVLDEDFEYSAQDASTLKQASRSEVLKAHKLFPEATIYATDESGDVAENLSRYWLSLDEPKKP